MAKLSLIDGLTGIANRRHFDETYQKEWSTACRHGQNLSVIMFDVDYFKPYNDYYGHLQGDICLKNIAAILNQNFRRSGELVARYGGEEFVILITNSNLEDVRQRTQHVIDLIYSNRIEHLKSLLLHITLSASIASQIIDKNSPQNELIKIADQALYQAKTQGRNQLAL